MQAIVESGNGHRMQMRMTFEDFMASGHMRNLSMVQMCSPSDLILDHLPGFDVNDNEELREAFAEACEEASEYGIQKVKLDEEDIDYVTREFLTGRHFRVIEPQYLPAA